jgi:hypothetical protein
MINALLEDKLNSSTEYVFSFSHLCKVLQDKHISVFWDSGIGY